MFAELGWREGWQICGPLLLLHPGNTDMDMVPHTQVINIVLPNFFIP